ncbi:hypothetical protein GE09DRAFT_124401 [Coniochaeta sp. 2T2.1]|nr:hypothetical protein GE09DRAFT_124401 [Coniochaeta sp. 2T2.1]
MAARGKWRQHNARRKALEWDAKYRLPSPVFLGCSMPHSPLSKTSTRVQVLCNSYSRLFEEGKVGPSSAMSVLPPATTHPVVLTKKLLQIVLCIQQLAPSDMNLDATRYFTLASSMVTCHKELLDSVEGLGVSLYKEAAYLVTCGNLRRALIVLPRAATLAHPSS